jgi:ectoine hydroxylase-related dioxygenase (phytanoyl-CoA dioxygenase family)
MQGEAPDDTLVPTRNEGQLDRDGFEIVRNLVDPIYRSALVDEIEAHVRGVPIAGVRGLARKIEAVRTLADSPAVRALVTGKLGGASRLVRSILFNKTKQANWQVAWHQDLAIAVRERAEVDGFGPWSIKEGVVHVQPPENVLEQLLTVRLHLDPTDETNGALWVVAGSHRNGRLRARDAAAVAARSEQHLCALNAGDALLFKPLVLHASRKVTSDTPRRVIHFEFAAVDLPSPLRWAEEA